MKIATYDQITQLRRKATLVMTFNGEVLRERCVEYTDAADLSKQARALCGKGWGVRVAVSAEDAEALGAYTSTCGETLAPVAGEYPMSVRVVAEDE